jgi:PEP-CTERM motif
MKTLIALLALALLATTASADTVWNYQGNAINYFEGTVPGPSNISPFALTGSVTLNDQNVAVAWSFNDGLSTLTNLNSTGQPIDSLFGAGNKPFDTWRVDLTGNGDHIRSVFFGSLNEAIDFGRGGLVNVRSDPGTWTEEVVGTPEPGTLALLGVGLAGFLARKYRRVSPRSLV